MACVFALRPVTDERLLPQLAAPVMRDAHCLRYLHGQCLCIPYRVTAPIQAPQVSQRLLYDILGLISASRIEAVERARHCKQFRADAFREYVEFLSGHSYRFYIMVAQRTQK